MRHLTNLTWTINHFLTHVKEKWHLFPFNQHILHDHQPQQVATLPFDDTLSREIGFPNPPLRLKNPLPSGNLEGVVKDEQALMRGTNSDKHQVRKWERKWKCPAHWCLPRPTLLNQEGHWGKLDKACTTSIWIKLFVPQDCLLFYFPLFRICSFQKITLNGSLVPPKRPGQIMQACLVTPVTKWSLVRLQWHTVNIKWH